MAIVKKGPQDTVDSLIRKFTKKVISEGILLELKKREFYQKPSILRREKKKASRRKKRSSSL